MLEAMASGTPVAAYPVDGPLEVLGGARKPDGSCHGGVMHSDLRQACYGALAVPRHEARTRALDFKWTEAAHLFICHLVGTRKALPDAALPNSNATGIKKDVTSTVKGLVTPLSSNQ